jgi:uncharacterized protein YndB with AHSA1/START domain
MAKVHASIDIAAPVQHVWNVVTDLERLDEWVSIHRDFPQPPPAEVAQDTTFRQTLAVAGTPFSVEWTAVDVDGPRRLSWRGTGPAGTTARTTYALEEADGGTRFAYENEFQLPAGDVGRAASGVVAGHAEREANESLTRLKRLVEAS